MGMEEKKGEGQPGDVIGEGVVEGEGMGSKQKVGKSKVPQ